MNATLETVLSSLLAIQNEIASVRPNLAAFAYSPDLLDRWVAEGVRARALGLAKLVCELSDEQVERVSVCLFWVCSGDVYATAEVAGRFMSAVRRLRLAAAIRRHPRAFNFGSLVSAIERGKYTKAQYALASKLAKEAA